MKEIEVIIDTDELAEFIYEQLLLRGYVPSGDEVEEVADVVFDYLLSKQVVEEVWDEEDIG
ncbi:YozD family protein [Bacillus sp. DJP31]|uniref:YozD family protein n=1 Tax=Bacillus sp. DJP31 TaxID=3409789 RepID=UPI003BB7154C